MRKNYFTNIQILLFFAIFTSLLCRSKLFSPFDDNDDDFNPFNAFLNFNNIANQLMNDIDENVNHSDEQEENKISPLGANKPKKSKDGNVSVEETKNKNGMQRKVVRDLGNGVKTVEITQVYNRRPQIKNDIQPEDIFNPFGNPMGFPGMGMPTIIIGRKNLKKGRGSPIISPINLFTEIDSIFDNLFESIAETIISENVKNGNKTNSEDDHIELDEIDLSLNETHVENSDSHKHNDHEEHIKLNYIKDLQEDKDINQKKENIYYNPDNPNAQYSNQNKQEKLNNDEHHELALIPENVNFTNDKTDRRALIKEQIAKKKQEQTKNRNIKNPYFVKICKILFYLLCLVSFYIIIRKLLEKYGFIVNTVELENNASKNSKTMNNSDEIPLKQSELTEIKQANNKND